MRVKFTELDLVWIIHEYHRDRVFPCLKSEVRDLAEFYCVDASRIVEAINTLLAEEDCLIHEGEYQ